MSVSVSVCLPVGHRLFVWFGLFMCTLVRYLVLWVLFFNCLVGCFSMIVWTFAVLSVLYACFAFLYLHLFSAIEHVSHEKAI